MLKAANQSFKLKSLQDGNKVMDGTVELFDAMTTGVGDITAAGAPMLEEITKLTKGLDAMAVIQNGAKEGTEEYTEAMTNLANATNFSEEQ